MSEEQANPAAEEEKVVACRSRSTRGSGKEGRNRRGSAQERSRWCEDPSCQGSKNITSGIVNVLATFNNTKVTFTDARGNVISWSSAGKCELPRLSQVHCLRRPGCDPGCRPRGCLPRHEGSRRQAQGPWHGSRLRRTRTPIWAWSSPKSLTSLRYHNGCRAPKRRRVWCNLPP